MKRRKVSLVQASLNININFLDEKTVTTTTTTTGEATNNPAGTEQKTASQRITTNGANKDKDVEL